MPDTAPRFSPTQRKRIGVSLSALVALAAAVSLYLILRHGPGASPDSASYAEAAWNLMNGRGLTVGGAPLTHYPPLYPALLGAVVFLFGGDWLDAGRWVAAVSFGLNVLLLGLAAQGMTRGRFAAIGLVLGFFLLSSPVWQVQAMAWSDAPFVALCLSSLLLLSRYLSRGGHGALLGAAAAAGLAMLTRYAGLALLPALALPLLCFGRRPLWQRLRDVAAVTGVAVPPLLLWVVRNRLSGGSVTNRSFVFHPFGIAHTKQLVANLHDFLLYLPVSGWWKLPLVLAAAAGLLALLWRLRWRGQLRREPVRARVALPGVFLCFAAVYLAFLVVSISCFDAYTPLDYRILLPLWAALLPSGVAALCAANRTRSGRNLWRAALALGCVMLAVNAPHALRLANQIRQDGYGYTASRWRTSETVRWASACPDETAMYSNGPDILFFLAGKPARMLPKMFDPSTRRPNPDYGKEQAELAERCRAGQAVVILLDGVTWRAYLPTRTQWEEETSHRGTRQFSDGAVYGTLPVLPHEHPAAPLPTQIPVDSTE